MKIVKRLKPKRDRQNWQGVSKTAHFTAAVWHELGIAGAQRFVTRQGKLLRWVVKWGGGLFGLFGQYSVVNLFLAPRYLGIDALLAQKWANWGEGKSSDGAMSHRNDGEEKSIGGAMSHRNEEVFQIIELAAGLAPRGIEWVQSHRNTSYIEIDQPALIAVKQRILAPIIVSLPPEVHYQLIPADILSSKFNPPGNPTGRVQGSKFNPSDNFTDRIHSSSSEKLKTQNSKLKTLIICEGMTGYLGEEAMRKLLGSIKGLAEGFEDCTILIDFYVKLNFRRHGRVALAMLPAQLLWRMLRAPMQMFLRDADHIRALLHSEGFAVQQLYSSQELAALAGISPPPINLFYVAELKIEREFTTEGSAKTRKVGANRIRP